MELLANVFVVEFFQTLRRLWINLRDGVSRYMPTVTPHLDPATSRERHPVAFPLVVDGHVRPEVDLVLNPSDTSSVLYLRQRQRYEEWPLVHVVTVQDDEQEQVLRPERPGQRELRLCRTEEEVVERVVLNPCPRRLDLAEANECKMLLDVVRVDRLWDTGSSVRITSNVRIVCWPLIAKYSRIALFVGVSGFW
jgi:hypothetical protein